MLEYRDGTFSPELPINEAFEKFWNELEEGKDIKSLHVGTKEELEEIRNRKTFSVIDEHAHKGDLQAQIDDLKAAVEDLKPVKSSYIHIPTDQERKALQDIMDAGKKKETVFLFDSL